MAKRIRIPRELYGVLEVVARKRGISVDDAVNIFAVEMFERLKAKREGKEAVFLYDYGEKGFVVSMPEDLPRRDPEHKNVKVVRIEMPEDAEYPMPK